MKPSFTRRGPIFAETDEMPFQRAFSTGSRRYRDIRALITSRWCRIAALVALGAPLSLSPACDAGGSQAPDAADAPSPCCPIDYYQCDGGRIGGARQPDGSCPRYADQTYNNRVIVKDSRGCDMIDRVRSEPVSCLLRPDVRSDSSPDSLRDDDASMDAAKEDQ
ncbi:MAG: hypothetical protein SF187_05385 [Deltaproteobacteria bacterium]|nr:hypothetical protein [Deltaproteobacteria bacterium]